jgi:hypothetical protein
VLLQLRSRPLQARRPLLPVLEEACQGGGGVEDRRGGGGGAEEAVLVRDGQLDEGLWLFGVGIGVGVVD